MPLVAKRSLAPQGMPCSGPVYLPARISLSACAAWASASSSVSVTTQLQLRPELLEPVEVHLREVGRGDFPPLDERCERGDREEREIVERGSLRAADACSVTLIFAPGVAPGFGFLPGRYGRNVIAGSVSSGTSIARSCSKASRLRLTPASACSSSASEKSTPKIFSPHSSTSLLMRRACSCAGGCASAGSARPPATAAGTAFRNRRRRAPSLRSCFIGRFSKPRRCLVLQLEPCRDVDVGRARRPSRSRASRSSS